MPTLHSRRALLHLATSVAVATTFPARARTTAAAAIGLQTITIMPELSRDLAGTLRNVRRIGYRDLETSGSLGLAPHALRDSLDNTGLSTAAQHVCPNAFYAIMQAWSEKRMSMTAVFEEIARVYRLDKMPALIDEAIATATILGQRTIVWSNLLADDTATPAAAERLADAFTAAARQCRAAGLTFAFHNGSKGFVPVGGKRPYDILLERTDPKLVKMELDVYWARKVGIDPLAYLAAHPGRYTLCHLKDMNAAGDIVAIGEGVIDFAAVLAAGARAGVSDYYVEYDQAPYPLANAAAALKRLKAIRT